MTPRVAAAPCWLATIGVAAGLGTWAVTVLLCGETLACASRATT